MSATQEEKKIHMKLTRLLNSSSNPGDVSLRGISRIESLALVQIIDNRMEKEKERLVKLANSYNEQMRRVDGLRRLRRNAAKKFHSRRRS